MRLFHFTTTANAISILKEGFTDRGGCVWFSTEPLNAIAGLTGRNCWLVVEIPDDLDISEFERPGQRDCREWQIPAAVIAQYQIAVADHQFAGCSEAGLLRNIDVLRSEGRTKAAELLKMDIEFLREHNLLDNEG